LALPSGIFLPGSPVFGAGICSTFGAGAGAAAAAPQQESPQVSQQLLWWNLLSSRFRMPSSQPQSQLDAHAVVHFGAAQVSQLLDEWKRLNRLLRHESHESQAGLQAGAGVQHVSQPQLE
jgi:hypothetical protein